MSKLSPGQKALAALAERDQLFAEVGRAIATWQAVETYLSDLFHDAIRGTRPYLSYAAFATIANFRGKLEIINALIRRDVPEDDPLIAEWEKLHERVRKRSKQRNLIAHREPRIIYGEPGKDGFQPSIARLTYSPTHPDAPVTIVDAKRNGFSVKELKEISQSFADLIEPIAEFQRKLVQRQKQP